MSCKIINYLEIYERLTAKMDNGQDVTDKEYNAAYLLCKWKQVHDEKG